MVLEETHTATLKSAENVPARKSKQIKTKSVENRFEKLRNPQRLRVLLRDPHDLSDLPLGTHFGFPSSVEDVIRRFQCVGPI